MIYRVDYHKLALLLLPTFLRKPILTAFITALTRPISDLHVDFLSYMKEKNYRLEHNGQVCYLRAVLNDKFDPVQRRITITDNPDGNFGQVIYMREVERPLLVPERESQMQIIINRKGYGGINGYDFWINLPSSLQGHIDERLVNAVVNIYKLASKRYAINYN